MFDSHRATNILLVLILTAGIGIVAMLASGVRAGPLDPPGAPAPSDGVREPGTPITSLPFTISQPGYYYLTHNLTSAGAGQNGITITSSRVTLDLKGFVLDGLDETGKGITGTNFKDEVVIRNGLVTRWAYGVDGGFTTGATYDGLTIGLTEFYAITTGTHATLKNCTLTNNLLTGVALGVDSTMRGCNINGSGGDHVQADTGTEIAENHFSGSPVAPWSAVAVTGNNVHIHDNFFGSTGVQVSLGQSSSKVFLLGNWLSCGGIDDPNPDSGLNYYVLNATTIDDTNWCY
jgi:hypothetical protein